MAAAASADLNDTPEPWAAPGEAWLPSSRWRGVPPLPPYQVRGRPQPSPIEGEGVLRRAQDERRFTLTPTLSHRGRGGSFDRLRTNGDGRAQDERAGYPHPNPLPSRERGSFDRLRTNGGLPSPQPSPIEGEGVLRRAQDERRRLGSGRTGVGGMEGFGPRQGTRLPHYARNDRGRGLG